MIDPIKARQEYQSWLRKGGDEIVWIPFSTYLCKYDMQFPIGHSRSFFHRKTDEDDGIFLFYFTFANSEPYWSVSYWNNRDYRLTSISKNEAEINAQKLYRKWMFKQLTGDDLIE